MDRPRDHFLARTGLTQDHPARRSRDRSIRSITERSRRLTTIVSVMSGAPAAQSRGADRLERFTHRASRACGDLLERDRERLDELLPVRACVRP